MPGAQRRTVAPLALAGYAWTREITGTPLHAGQAELLRTAQDVVDQTRATLHHGRGNVTTDVARTQGESTTRSMAARELLNQLPVLVPGVHRMAMLVRMGQASAAAAYAGAGRCGEHARVAIAAAAPHLRDGDTVTLVEDFDQDHSWTALNRTTDHGEVEAIADPWSEGPAFLAEDGEHTFQETGDVSTDSLTKQEAAVVRRMHDHALSELPQGDQRERNISTLAARARASGAPEPRMWPPTPALSGRHVLAAQERHAHLLTLAPDMQPPLPEQLAVRADRRLGTPVEVAEARAADVVQAGLSLPAARFNFRG
jgi:hypothetical protein